VIDRAFDASTSANIIIYHAVTKHFSAPPPFTTIGELMDRFDV
jgi:hypothetical protein